MIHRRVFVENRYLKLPNFTQKVYNTTAVKPSLQNPTSIWHERILSVYSGNHGNYL